MKKITVIIGVVLLIIIFLAISIPLFNSSLFKDDKNPIVLDIKMNTNDPRTFNQIDFNITNVPLNGNYTWDFGDGNVSYGLSVSHIYHLPDYYNVSVETKSNGVIYNKTINIVVKPEDSIGDFSGNSDRDFRRSFEQGNGVFYKNLDDRFIPTLTVSVNVKNVIGRIGVIVSVWKYTENGLERTELVNTVDNNVYTNIDYNDQFSPDEFDIYPSPFQFVVEIHIVDGRHGPWEISISAEY